MVVSRSVAFRIERRFLEAKVISVMTVFEKS